MIIDELNPGKQALSFLQNNVDDNNPDIKKSDKFIDSLKELMSDVNSIQRDSADLTDKFIKGEPVDLHDVMIASEKAKTSFELLMQLRNKFTDMYQEINRMQI